MKQSQLKQLIKEQILAELEPVSSNSLTYGITTDNQRIKFELDENNMLDCINNNLKTLVVNDPRVKTIYCNNNQLTTLKLGRLLNLRKLFCHKNQLTTLDISKCPNLEYLHCSENQLTTLDISKCPNLKYLHCSENQLTTLDVSNCPRLIYLEYDKGKTKLIK